MPVYNDRGAFVASRFARVFGDNEDDIQGWPSCLSVTALVERRAPRDDAYCYRRRLDR